MNQPRNQSCGGIIAILLAFGAFIVALLAWLAPFGPIGPSPFLAPGNIEPTSVASLVTPTNTQLATATVEQDLLIATPTSLTDEPTLPAFLKAPYVLGAHTDWISDVAFSPDSNILASVGRDLVIRLWDVAQPNKPPQLLTNYGAPWYGGEIAFSPNGQLLAAVAQDGVVLWSLNNLETLPIRLPLNSAYKIGFSPDGEWLASTDYFGPTAIWRIDDLATTLDPLLLDSGQFQVWEFAFSPDSQLLTTAGCDADPGDEPCDGASVYVWSLDNQSATPRHLQGGFGNIQALAFHISGEILVAGGCVDIMVDANTWNCPESLDMVWNIRTGEGRPLAGSGPWSTTYAVNPESGQLAAGGFGSEIQIWDPVDPAIWPRTLPGGAATTALEVSADGRWLAASDTVGTIRLWSVDGLYEESILEMGGLNSEDEFVFSEALAFSNNNRWVAFAYNNELRLWELPP